MLDRATPTLRERLLSKIVMPGPATPCAVYVGAYNQVGASSVKKHCKHHRRPVIRLGGQQTPVVYVAPLLLKLAGVAPNRPEQNQACHVGCPTGPAWDGVYRCVDLDHLRWGTQAENERHKQQAAIDDRRQNNRSIQEQIYDLQVCDADL